VADADGETFARQLARFAVTNPFDNLPTEVIASVKARVLDILGLCIAAASLDTSRAAREYADSQGGRPEARAVGVPNRLPASAAAFVNGVLAHSLDYDDTHLPSVLHPSASVVPAALAAGQAVGATGSATIAAMAAGLEVCVRLGMAGYDVTARNSTFFEHGQHATSIVGTIGSAVAAGMLFGFDEARLVDAIGISASMASGILEGNRTGGTVKRIHCGWAAQAGVSAARLTACGFSGPPTVLEGRFGFFQAWLHGHFDADAITGNLGLNDGGLRWSIQDIFFKPYPANHFTHAAVDAAIGLRRRGVKPADVASAVLGVAGPTVRTIGEPIESKRTPDTGYMAQFSGPYAVAVGLFGGSGLGAGLSDYSDELARDPERRALMARVEVVADARCTEIFPFQFPAVLTVRLYDGTELVEEVWANRGGSQHPLTREELATKFRGNTDGRLESGIAESLQAAVGDLDTLDTVSSLLEPLGRVDEAGISPQGAADGEA
jgi:2-methylcitrate dehydratase PrpD